MIQLSKDIWSLIRTFSGPNERTPTAEIIGRDIMVRDDSRGTWCFPHFSRDGYASTIVHAFSPAFFLKGRGWLWLPDTSSYIRVLHLTSDGYFVRASQ
jgi:hypothetical protein